MNFVKILIFDFFYHIFGHESRTAQPNLMSHTPIDKSFNCASFGIYKVIKFFSWRKFWNTIFGFYSEGSRVQPTGNSQKIFFFERAQSDLYQYKNFLSWINESKVIDFWKKRQNLWRSRYYLMILELSNLVEIWPFYQQKTIIKINFMDSLTLWLKWLFKWLILHVRKTSNKTIELVHI